MKIVVTGGKGFIGTHLVNRLKKEGINPIVLDLKNGKDIRKCNLPKADVVFHLAARRSVFPSFSDAEEYFSSNVFGTYRILEAYKDARVINVSSGSVPSAKSPYAITKECGETIAKHYPNTVNVRLLCVFGEQQTYETKDDMVIPLFAKAMLQNKPCYIYGSGKQKRDFTHIDDVVKELLWHGFHKSKGLHEVGYGKPITINSLFSKMAKFYGYKRKPVYLPARRGDFHKTTSSNKLHIKNIIGFDDGLVKTMQWWKESFQVCLKKDKINRRN